MSGSFFSALKNEWLSRFTFTTRAEVQRQVVRYTERFYNHRCMHAGLGYYPHQEAEDLYLTQQAAAWLTRPDAVRNLQGPPGSAGGSNSAGQ